MSGYTDAQLRKAARALCEHHAGICNVNADDDWKFYSENYVADARCVLDAAALTERQAGSSPIGVMGMSDLAIEQAREAFQAWAAPKGYSLHTGIFLSGQRDEYSDDATERVWRIWQDALSTRAPSATSSGVDDLVLMPDAYLHTVINDDGDQDYALSFEVDSFPFQGVGGYRSVACYPLHSDPAIRRNPNCLHDWAEGYGVPPYCNHCGIEREMTTGAGVDEVARDAEK